MLLNPTDLIWTLTPAAKDTSGHRAADPVWDWQCYQWLVQSTFWDHQHTCEGNTNTDMNSIRRCSKVHWCKCMCCRLGSLMRPLKRTCLSLQEVRNTTKRKTHETQRKTEVQKTCICKINHNYIWFVESWHMCVCTVLKNSSLDSTEQKKTRVKLKKFLTRRPTLQAVRDKGYIKGKIHW